MYIMMEIKISGSFSIDTIQQKNVGLIITPI